MSMREGVSIDPVISALRVELQDWESGWSVGSFGAIGEFHQDADEKLIVDEELVRATSRGAIRITPRSNMQVVAYELLSPRPHRWSQGLALCLPQSEAPRAQRSVLTELGPDVDAIKLGERDDILFDIGLEQPQIDFCIRTRDPELLRTLRACCGRPTFASEAGHAIFGSHPHRVVISHLGRVEVYQKIGGPDTGGVSPPGPHTHVLPKLLAAKRTHSANTPIPDGVVPCAFVYPANPVIGPLGDDKPFDKAQFDRFQGYLELYGARDYVQTKRVIWQAVENGQDPALIEEPGTRLERAALRNVLRQAARAAGAASDEVRSRRVSVWRARFDKADGPDESESA